VKGFKDDVDITLFPFFNCTF